MLDGLKHGKVKKNFDVGFLSTANFRGGPEPAQGQKWPNGALLGSFTVAKRDIRDFDNFEPPPILSNVRDGFGKCVGAESTPWGVQKYRISKI